jgi:hypothetical protein
MSDSPGEHVNTGRAQGAAPNYSWRGKANHSDSLPGGNGMRDHDLNSRWRFKLSDGSVEGLKWIGLLAMTVDHVNRYLLNPPSLLLYGLGRVALPIFGVVFAYNLTRPGVLSNVGRWLPRLLSFGLVAQLAYVLLQRPLTLNVLFTLTIAALVVWIVETRPSWAGLAWALAVFGSGGAVVEFRWWGVGYVIAAYLWCRRRGSTELVVWIAATAMLFATNRNFYALLAIPIVLFASWQDWNIPRARWLFYVYYPAHLLVLAMAARILRSGGTSGGLY